jgi:hypothetical protein
VESTGFISFTVMVLLESHVLSHGSEWVVGFEFAHITVFVIALVYVLQALLLCGTATKVKEWVYKVANMIQLEQLDPTVNADGNRWDMRFLVLEFHVSRWRASVSTRACRP